MIYLCCPGYIFIDEWKTHHHDNKQMLHDDLFGQDRQPVHTRGDRQWPVLPLSGACRCHSTATLYLILTGINICVRVWAMSCPKNSLLWGRAWYCPTGALWSCLPLGNTKQTQPGRDRQGPGHRNRMTRKDIPSIHSISMAQEIAVTIRWVQIQQ